MVLQELLGLECRADTAEGTHDQAGVASQTTREVTQEEEGRGTSWEVKLN